ncbi:universal stress protein [Amycolatopsis cihanbeyliensis]|uniref:Nucleotide-binding universal stress UspA family protein n=1 Tax=Amycolatopsis cihanbeyliensis TaxID=1128664 RepID=A0A542CSD7_AMYCI|nr:universal stress protein [Amycolatopsis cihanbeyliensis]TQI93737.1 nucleotide-binding universal stress UspA family protein [Amycolatopsis cihanbeyliensis]
MTDTAQQHAILAGVDGSDTALLAVRWAALEARRRDLPLRLLHVGVTYPLIARGHDDGIVAQGDEWVNAAAGVAAGAAPGVRIERQVTLGDPAQMLVEASGQARTVVLGSRGLGGFGSLLVGSIAVTVTAHAHCPVVVLRGEGLPRADAPVVVGMDGSPAGESAVEFAFEQASMRQAPLVAAHTWHESALDGAWVAEPFAIDVAETHEGERRLLSERLAGWREKYPEVEVRPEVLHTRWPAKGLLEAAAAAQLLVVGSHGRNALTGLLLGSTSQALLHKAECPVAVVRAEDG